MFNTYVKILRFNNTKEYFNSSFTNVMIEHVIIHQSSRVYTPQQNGVDERKKPSLA